MLLHVKLKGEELLNIHFIPTFILCMYNIMNYSYIGTLNTHDGGFQEKYPVCKRKGPNEIIVGTQEGVRS